MNVCVDNERLEGQMDECIGEWMVGWINGWMDEYIVDKRTGRTDGLVYGWMWMGGWVWLMGMQMGGWTDHVTGQLHLYACLCYKCVLFPFSCPGLVYQLCDSLHARVQVTTSDGWIQVIGIVSNCTLYCLSQRVSRLKRLVQVPILWLRAR